jgi:two-component system, sensor histidine kinase and response regulator
MSRILVIDDTAEIRSDIGFLLAAEGYEVLEADSGRKGIELAQTWAPDVIVCDINMPHMDGYAVLKQIRNLAVTRITPFIFLTARSERIDVRAAMDAGADDFITKPFQPPELITSVRTQINKTEMRIKETEARIKEFSKNVMTAVPHELRTPLNTVSGYADMLMNQAHEVDSDQVVEWAQYIKEAGERLYQLVEHQILYVRLQVAAHTAEKRAEYAQSRLTDVNELVAMIATQLGDKAGRKDDLKFDLEPAPVVAFTYPDLIKILIEVLDNAFKFAPPHQPIHLVGRARADSYSICIQDRGRGMTAAQITQIGPYMQFDRDTYQQPGLGLGLAIVQEYLDLYGGRLEIISNPGQGTHVYLHLRCV